MRTENKGIDNLINDSYNNPVKLTSGKGIYLFMLPENMAAVFSVLSKASLCAVFSSKFYLALASGLPGDQLISFVLGFSRMKL